MSRARTITTATLAVALGAGALAAVPTSASAASAPVKVSVGVSTSTFTPYADGVTDRAVLRVRLSRKARLKLFVADANGTTVRKIYLGTVDAGLHRPTWDGRTAGGALLPTGSYRVSFKAYKDGRRTVTSKVRSVRLQQQRLADRTSSVVVRGADFEPALSRLLTDGDADGTIFLGHGTDPSTDVAGYQAAVPAHVGTVRARVRLDLRSARFEEGNVSYGYRVPAAGGGRTFADTPIPRTDSTTPYTVDGRWADVDLAAGETFAWRVVVTPFANVRLGSTTLDLQYRALVPA
ncbi:FlgD immunoglobulin-like domain containing protein [Solicola sp. PLA-1-18]|uniref:FlgD immunoglobulin-like domain containing protein n=1 Tax=Solicola sp. PLA-1-18 TaxID=3380532 RepID=UPI003B76367C